MEQVKRDGLELRRERGRAPEATVEPLPAGAWARVTIEGVSPEIDAGRFPVKRVQGDLLEVEADIFCDGHEKIDAAVLFKRDGVDDWQQVPMRPLGNDRWSASFPLSEIGCYRYTIEAWRDPFATWADEVAKKSAAGQSVLVELIEVRALIEKACQCEPDSAENREFSRLRRELDMLGTDATSAARRLGLLLQPAIFDLFATAGPRLHTTRYERELVVWVDRTAAAFSAWYELTPRSQAGEPGRHGTFDDVIRRLPYVSDLGFDVLYLTPIHPIGQINRKGRNNSLKAEAGDPGSPYAIGSVEGGHDAIHPELGTVEDFSRLIEKAHEHHLELALDFAIQCAPDHPWIHKHPEWFDWRPDGSIRFAENPPKKYEDIVNVHFYRDAFPSIWFELLNVVLLWADRGVRIFRVDNPHTKPFPFWEWLIFEVQKRYPDVIFLSEAFTRPKPMKRLAKLGFTQSYSYFTWRNTKQELTEYLTELTRGPSREFMRPNFFTNTPDINPYYLQTSGRPGFQARLILAATLGGNYGIYNGFELCEARPVPGKEEYLDSEKYELKVWDWDRAGHIREDIKRINRLRREHPALQRFDNLTFYNAWNDNIIYYGKATADKRDFLLFAVNLDPHNQQGAHFEVPLWEFGLADDATIEAVDLVLDRRFSWTGKVQHMWFDPNERTYMIWQLMISGKGGR
jgi:starch synthase (maltosyl-transferring)